jgi:predicted dithiol-disulfide oxidoreductase (DUF899 family)
MRVEPQNTPSPAAGDTNSPVRSAIAARATPAATAAALTGTVGLAAACWVVAVWQMNGMDVGTATQLGSFGFFIAVWVAMMAAMMLPGAAPAVLRRARAGGVRAVPLLAGSYLAQPANDVTTTRRQTMTSHKTGTREEWLATRLELLQAEKELTRRTDELARRRQELPWVRLDKQYRFDTDEATATLADLFAGRSQLLVYHFMFGPDYTAGCPSCSAIADGFSGSVVHLANHDVTLTAVSRAPIAKIQAYKRRMGWSFPFASSYGSDFNYDFQVGHTKEAWDAGAVEYNFRVSDLRPSASEENSWNAWAEAIVGTDWETYRREGPGMSAFALEDGVVYHTYSAYERGLDAVWGMYPWLDRAPLGRNETGMWWRRHDEYDAS